MMAKYRLEKETENQAVLVVKTKLLFVENGSQLRELMTDFYLQLGKDINLLKSLNIE